MYRVETPYVDKLVALKYLALSLPQTSPEFLIDQNRFLLELSYTFSQYFITCLLTDIRREVNSLESYVVVQELATCLALLVFMEFR